MDLLRMKKTMALLLVIMMVSVLLLAATQLATGMNGQQQLQPRIQPQGGQGDGALSILGLDSMQGLTHEFIKVSVSPGASAIVTIWPTSSPIPTTTVHRPSLAVPSLAGVKPVYTSTAPVSPRPTIHRPSLAVSSVAPPFIGTAHPSIIWPSPVPSFIPSPQSTVYMTTAKPPKLPMATTYKPAATYKPTYKPTMHQQQPGRRLHEAILDNPSIRPNHTSSRV